MTAPRNLTAVKLEFFDRLVRDPRLKGLDIRVAWRIVDRANSDLTAWPSFKLLASELGISARSAMRSIERLCALDWIGKAKGGGRSKYNRYTLKIETMTTVSGFAVSREKSETVTGLSGNCDNPSRKTVTRVSPESLKESIQESSRAHEAGATPMGAPASAPVRNVVVRRWRRHARDRGIRLEPVDDAPWRRIMEEIAGRIGAGPVRMWLDPLVFIGIEGSVVRLGSPSDTIRKFALRTLAAGAGEAHQFEIVVGAKFSLPREPRSCSEHPKTWKQSTHACQRSPATGNGEHGKSGRRWR